ncbi:hypothetical protein SERLA73DRAFT_173661 [Serpula lacrymans var. lacrymans S7.3]|uniref:Hemerythrin-like domain-containing protein n=2 Tax=Serpula lacrymans var. lacrymans TaxID=341189 RepID=F8PFB2_SERL3|nr:uncharacterized protein SERLADRAFT_454458 [Serpula lacrymans var. lacrymans S7.9]EGO04218.1 hypothetical protein SERLA73DRAFT_173661 [Serpula lacrymans var. lacrymans S7.3]EGO30157.1 hypothetical protein SERLADRAFT_454458 [Serpula lacrymans var. lacrymans S7.9]
MHYNMARAHDTFKAGYDSIFSRLDNPPTNDLANFMGYCAAWAFAIAEHHDTEETIVFPRLEGRVDFSTELEQHKVVHAGLDEIIPYIQSAQTDTSMFDAEKLKGMMQAFREPLFRHMDEELEHVQPANLKVMPFEEMEELNETLDSYAKANGDPFILVPFMMSHTAPEFKDSWPQMPWVLRSIVIPYVLAVRHYGYWKYSPYSMC